MQQALGGRAERSLAACFAGWHAAASASARRKHVLAHAVGRLTQQQLSTALCKWREAAALRRRHRSLIAAAVTKLGGQRLWESFGWWRQWAGYSRQLAGIERCAVAGLHRRRLAGCMVVWQAEARRLATAKRCLAAMRLRVLRQCFNQWRDAAEDSCAEAASAALAPKLLRRAFLQWRTALRLAAQKRQRLEKAAALAFGSSRLRAWKVRGVKFGLFWD